MVKHGSVEAWFSTISRSKNNVAVFKVFLFLDGYIFIGILETETVTP